MQRCYSTKFLVFTLAFLFLGTWANAQTQTHKSVDKAHVVSSFPYYHKVTGTSVGGSASGMKGTCHTLACCSVWVYKVILPTAGSLRIDNYNFSPLGGSIIAYRPVNGNKTPTSFSDLNYVSQAGNFCGFRDTMQLGRGFGWKPVNRSSSGRTNAWGKTPVFQDTIGAGTYYILAWNKNNRVNIGGDSATFVFRYQPYCPTNAVCNFQNIDVCDQTSYKLSGGKTVYQSGTYTDTFAKAAVGGKDSFLFTTLTLGATATSQSKMGDVNLCTGDDIYKRPSTNLVSEAVFSATDKDWIETNDVADSMAGTNRSVFTWMRKSSQVSGSNQMIHAINTSSNGNVCLLQVGTSEKLELYEGAKSLSTGVVVTDGEWHHVGYTYNETTDSTLVYVDGLVKLRFKNAQTVKATDKVSIGQEFDSGSKKGNYYDGELAEMSVWNEVLSTSDVRSLMQSAITNQHPKYNDLVAYYPMIASCATSNDSLYDYSGNKMHGVTSSSLILQTDSLVELVGYEASSLFNKEWLAGSTVLSIKDTLNATLTADGVHALRLYRDYFVVYDTFNVNCVACNIPLKAPLEAKWVDGSNNSTPATGIYGTKGVGTAFTRPIAKIDFVEWVDSKGNYYLFGGGYYNDLWKWDGKVWIWLSGDSTRSANGFYGVKGVGTAKTTPGARSGACGAVDQNDNFWLFGGYLRNDLWKWDGSVWTWVSGDSTAGQHNAVYGITGIPNSSNVPGYTRDASCKVDDNNNLVVYGGLTYNGMGGHIRSELWKWDGTNWTFVKGEKKNFAKAHYGKKGVASSLNHPSARYSSASWVDKNGNFWIYGGTGVNNSASSSSRKLNDLWKWDGINWTWMHGDTLEGLKSNFGTLGTSNASNTPGYRIDAANFTDCDGNLYLFGGKEDSDYRNDLWKWEGGAWTWIAGDSTADKTGVYGTMGVASSSNWPGARSHAGSYFDATTGTMNLYGGSGYSSTSTSSPIGLGDLWQIRTLSTPTPKPEIKLVFNTTEILDGDATPSATDSTNFGSVDTNSTAVLITYTVSNVGPDGDTLYLTGSPVVALSGTGASHFSIVSQPSKTKLDSGETSTFQVRYLPTAVGSHSAELSIANNDADENPYNFSIQGTGKAVAAPEPEINAVHAGVEIASGDNTPSITDGTDFGNTDTSTTTTVAFYIKNTGKAVLKLDNNPILLTGAGKGSEFTVAKHAGTTVAAGDSTEFRISFSPTKLGAQAITIMFRSNDADENPYTFDVKGTGIAVNIKKPEIEIAYKGRKIVDGSMVWSTYEGTDFGSVDANKTVSTTYYVKNLGDTVLTLNATPITNTGSKASEFTIATQPSTSVAVGDSSAFVVSFKPTAAGAVSTTLSVGSNDADENPSTFIVRGVGVKVYDPKDYFITKWKTDAAGSVATNNKSIKISTNRSKGGFYNYDIDWEGDGVFDTFNVSTDAIHQYNVADTYTVVIRGDFAGTYLVSNADNLKLLSVEQWGNTGLRTMNYAFYGCKNFTINATDTPDLSRVTDMSSAFDQAEKMNADISGWDVSSVKDMSGTFSGCKSFNQNIGSWNVSKVTNMGHLFNCATVFNQDISSWDVSKVTQMSAMFFSTDSFNQPIGKWDVSAATDMGFMFTKATSFNQDISSWDMSKVTLVYSMFSEASAFNQPIGKWDVSAAENMGNMFVKANKFNQDIGKWDVSSVTSMSRMFGENTAFNQDLNDWDMSTVTSTDLMFYRTNFNQDISDWDVSAVTNMSNMFYGTDVFDQNLGAWDMSSVTDVTDFLKLSGLSKSNYDSLLIGWSTQNLNGNLKFNAGSSKYCLGESARDSIITKFKWIFTDAGKECGMAINIVLADSISCNGLSNAKASASISGGTAPYKYSWTNGDTTLSADSLKAGQYIFTVIDAKSDTLRDTLIVTQPNALHAKATLIAKTSSFTSADGVLAVAASGGNAPYTYSWSNATANDTAKGLTFGNYTAYVSDSLGCKDSTIVLADVKSTSNETETDWRNLGADEAIILDSYKSRGINFAVSKKVTKGIASEDNFSFEHEKNGGIDSSGFVALKIRPDVAGNDANYSELKIDLSKPIRNLRFSVGDIDASSDHGDSVTVIAFDSLGNTVIGYFTFAGDSVRTEYRGDTLTASGIGDAENDSTHSTVSYLFTSKVSRVAIRQYMHKIEDSRPGSQTVYISKFIYENDYQGIENQYVVAHQDADIIIDVVALNHVTYATPQTIKIAKNASNGTASVRGGMVSYSPDDRFNGIDSFQYQICDNNSICGKAWAFVSVVATYTGSMQWSLNNSDDEVVKATSIVYENEVSFTTLDPEDIDYGDNFTIESNRVRGLHNPSSYLILDVDVDDTYAADEYVALDASFKHPVANLGFKLIDVDGGDDVVDSIIIEAFDRNDKQVEVFFYNMGSAVTTFSHANGSRSFYGIDESSSTKENLGNVNVFIPDSVAKLRITYDPPTSTYGGDDPDDQQVYITNFVWNRPLPRAEVRYGNQTIASGTNAPVAINGTFLDTVILGDSASFIYQLHNIGTDTLIISKPLAANGASTGDIYMDVAHADTILPNDSSRFTMKFRPGSVGQHNNTVQFESNDVERHIYQFRMGGVAICPTLTLALTQAKNVTCNGAADALVTTNVSGGNAPYTYSWSNSSGNDSLVGVGAGIYYLTIKDKFSCEIKDSITITQPAQLVATAKVDSNITCNGLSDGGATITATGGTTPYTYLWSNSSTTASITGIKAGAYTVMVTDANGCTINKSATITEPTQLAASAKVDSNVTCSGLANGGASIAVSGGTTPYKYSWSNSATTASITGVKAGAYTVTVTDANGCTINKSATITEPTQLATSAKVDSNITCNGLSDGGASITATGGTMPYTYLWSNSAKTASIAGVKAGTYTVTVTDANGCIITKSATITEPSKLLVSAKVDSSVTCFGYSNGKATVTANGGTGRLQYVWNTNATTTSINGLVAGNYKVWVTDANACVESSQVSITQPTLLVSGAIDGDTTICSGATPNKLRVSQSTSGGVGSYTYVWQQSTDSLKWTNVGGATSASYQPGTIRGSNWFRRIDSDGNSCGPDTTNVLKIGVFAQPNAGLTATTACEGQQTYFTDTTTLAFGSINSYAWSFGDKGTSNQQNPINVYKTSGNYTVTLTVIADGGCNSIVTKTVSVNDVPSADFSATAECEGTVTQFTNKSTIGTGTLSYTWDLGDKNTSSTSNPKHTYLNSGYYTARLVATSSQGCVDSVSKTVQVKQVAKPNFSATAVCEGNSTSFTNLSTNASSYSWDFADGGSASKQANPKNKYKNSGTYNVVLTATSSDGCSDTALTTVSVYSLPVAGFTATEECLGEATDFTNASTGAATYQWVFGDGTSSNNTTPSVLYGKSGNYKVELTTTTTNGCTDVTSNTITVNALPEVSFTAADICLSEDLTTTNTTTGANKYDWSFGDGNTSTTKTPTHTYTANGRYEVMLVATSSKGCINSDSADVNVHAVPDVAFTATDVCFGLNTDFTNTTKIAAGTMTYVWDLGDGSTTGNPSPSYAYGTDGTYAIKLVATSNQGCKDSTTGSVDVFAMPMVDFTAASVCYGDTLFTNNLSSTAGYSWSLGDGTTSIDASPFNFYKAAGDYTLQLIATTTNNCVDSLSQDISIYSKPIADFDVKDVCDQEAVQFANTSYNAIITGNNWDFGDGNTDNRVNPSNLYASAGGFTTTLIVMSNEGCSDTLSKALTVHPNPVMAFTNTTECDYDSTVFTDGSSITSGTIGYAWDFGTGDASSVASPTYQYAGAGAYKVNLTGTSDRGCIKEASAIVVVNPSPKAALRADNNCEGMMSEFTSLSQVDAGSITAYQWNFGDGNTSTDKDPVYLYASDATYPIELVVETDQSCFDTVVSIITIYNKPTADFNTPDICFGGLSVFADASTDAGEYLYDFGDKWGISTLGGPEYTYEAPGSYDATLFVTSIWGCKDTVTKTIEIYSLPTAQFGINNHCFNEDFTPKDNSKGDVSDWNWSYDDGNSATGIDPIYTYSKDGSYAVKLEVEDDNGCIDSVRKTVVVWPLPVVGMSTDTLVSKGYTVPMLASGGVEYKWSPVDNLDKPLKANPTATVIADVEYTVTVANEFGCTRDTFVNLRVEEDYTLEPSNIMTPDGNGQNDNWVVEKAQYYNDVEVIVFDRWGRIVYQNSSYDNTWTGISSTGGDLPDGAYYYVVKVPADREEYKGSITIFR